MRPSGAALLLAAYAAAIVLRMPQIVLKGRFWAEEGTVFFANAWRLDPLSALLLPYGGYLNLVANGATVAARWAVPLANAPYVTTGIALFFQLVPPALLLTATDAWLQPWPVRIAGLALLLLVPGADEIWLQSLHVQFELALACGLILALDVPPRPRSLLALPILVLAPLCGPGAIAFIPLFLLRAAIERSHGRMAQLAALVIGSSIQLACFFSPGVERGYTLDPRILLAVVSVKDLIVPFLGVRSTTGYAAAIQAATMEGHAPMLAVVGPILVFGGVALIGLRSRNAPAFWLLAGAAAAALSAYIGALDGTVALIHPRAGGRYALVPISLTALSFLSLTATPFWRWPAGIVCAWLLVVGIQTYQRPWMIVRDGPAWSDEVARWQIDPTYEMQLWPTPWTLRLSAP